MATFSHQGLNLYYLYHTVPQNEFGTHPPYPLVCLNGMSQDTMSWSALVKSMRDQRSILVLDNLGQRRSDPPPENHDFQAHAQDVQALISNLGLENYHLLGFSYGARIGYELMQLDQNRIEGSILVGSYHRSSVRTRLIGQSWIEAIQKGGLDLMFDVVTPQIFGESYLASQAEYLEGFRQRFTRVNQPEPLIRLLKNLLDYHEDHTEMLQNWDQPLMFIWGEEDFIVPGSLVKQVQQDIPMARFEICEDAGHTVSIEASDWFNEKVISFLSEIEQ